MNKTTRTLVFIALYAAMAVVFDYLNQFIPFLQMPQGGSINIAVIPVFIASYQLGWKEGIVTGLLWWLIGLMFGLNNYMVSPMQTVLDYVIPAIICGFASALPRIGSISNVYVGITVTMLLKYVSHVLAGVYFWFPEGEAAGTIGAWFYSLNYNAWYNLATLVVAIIATPILIKMLNNSSVTRFSAIKSKEA